MMEEGEAVLVDELAEAQERVAELRTANAALVTDLITAQRKVERLAREIATLRETLAAAQGALGKVRSDLEYGISSPIRRFAYFAWLDEEIEAARAALDGNAT